MPLQTLRAHPRLTAAAGILIVSIGILLACGVRPTQAVLLGFDATAIVFLLTVARYFNRSTPETMRGAAATQAVGRWAILSSSVLLTAVVLIALGLELHASKGGSVLDIVLGTGSILLSWLFMNSIFAMHYAHGYYGNLGAAHRGLDFPGEEEPDYWDFTYFAVVIGMTFQVSDVQITSRHLRRMALLHGVIAFFMNVFIIAMTVNIVAGQA